MLESKYYNTTQHSHDGNQTKILSKPMESMDGDVKI